MFHLPFLNSHPTDNPLTQTLKWLSIEPHTASTGALAEWYEAETGIQIETTHVPYAEITQKAVAAVSGEWHIILSLNLVRTCTVSAS